MQDEKIFSLTSSREKVATQFYFLPFSEDGFAAKNFWKIAHIYLMKRKSFLIGDGGEWGKSLFKIVASITSSSLQSGLGNITVDVFKRK